MEFGTVSNASDSFHLSIGTEECRAETAFRWEDDRFSHAIRIELGQQSWELLSLEGNSEQPWPLSPSIQDLYREYRDGTDVLLGVGMAGKTHFSVSVESNQLDTLRFEFACKVVGRPEFVGTTYLLDSWVSSEVAIMREPFRIHDSTSVRLDRSKHTEHDRLFQIAPAETNSSATLQWGFDVVIAPTQSTS